MNLSKLFEAQRKLDEHIEREHPRKEGEDRLAKKILALMVELGELCQEWRGFKFWSNDQEPRTEYIVSKHEVYADDKKIHEWVDKKPGNPLLEEYVDCLHFMLSIGLELGMDKNADEWEIIDSNFLTSNSIIECFIGLQYDISALYYQREETDDVQHIYTCILSEFIKLGEMLGFTWQQIEEAYFQKNAVNHWRQDNAY